MTRSELQKFYIKEIANTQGSTYRTLKNYIARVCNAVSKQNDSDAYWQKLWATKDGTGRTQILKLLRKFLDNPDYYDPLGLRGL